MKKLIKKTFGGLTPSEAGKKSSRLGSCNISTLEVRKALQLLVEANMPKMQGWLDGIASKSPEKAILLILKLAELVLPKLHSVDVDQQLTGNMVSKVIFHDFSKSKEKKQ